MGERPRPRDAYLLVLACAVGGALLTGGCEQSLGGRERDAGARTDAAMDVSALDAPLASDDAGASALDAGAGDDATPAAIDAPVVLPDVPAAPDAPGPPFGPCGCEICPCPTPPPGCDFPQGVPEEDFTGADALPMLVNDVNAAMVAVTGCSVGSACPTGFTADHAGAQQFFDLVIAELRARGFCAGQHRSGETDEIAVSRNCRAVWEGYHVFAYGGATVVWGRNPSAPCGGSACPGLGGGSFRGIWWVPGSHCP